MLDIKIKFVDFWPDFNVCNNFIYNSLIKRYNVTVSDEPDVVFYSTYGYEHLNFTGVRVFYSGENQTPDFNICDYAMSFHPIQFEDRFLKIPLYFLYQTDLAKACIKHQITSEELALKVNFCNFIYSNRNAHPNRDLFFHQLNHYKHVDSGGGHLNNIGGRVQNKYDFQQNFKFTIAFENSSSNGYSTEKILQAYSAKTIPIYWGDPLIAQTFNNESFINCHDFKSFDDVIERIKEIDNNDLYFEAMLKAPITSPEVDLNSFFQGNLDQFLDTIFNQEADLRFRRNRHYWGLNYEQKMRTSLLNNVTDNQKSSSFIQKLKNRIR